MDRTLFVFFFFLSFFLFIFFFPPFLGTLLDGMEVQIYVITYDLAGLGYSPAKEG